MKATDYDGRTALHIASSQQDVKSVKVLLAAGVFKLCCVLEHALALTFTVKLTPTPLPFCGGVQAPTLKPKTTAGALRCTKPPLSTRTKSSRCCWKEVRPARGALLRLPFCSVFNVTCVARRQGRRPEQRPTHAAAPCGDRKRCTGRQTVAGRWSVLLVGWLL